MAGSEDAGAVGGWRDHHKRFSLDGRVSLVTGAERGIGLAIAQALASAGSHVVLADRSETVHDRSAMFAAAGFACDTMVADVADGAQIECMVGHIASRHGRIDILVNNAAILVRKGALEISRDEWQSVIDVNLSACFFMAQAVARGMVERGFGRIINLSSIVSHTARSRLSPYIAAKGGISALTRALATDLAGTGVNVNAIAPGFIETQMSGSNDETDFRRKVVESVPAGRWGQPEEVAGMAVVLASPAGDYVNGQTIFVDGGFTASSQ